MPNLSTNVYEKTLNLLDEFVLVAECTFRKNNNNNDNDNDNISIENINLNDNDNENNNNNNNNNSEDEFIIDNVVFVNNSLQNHLGWNKNNNNKNNSYEIQKVGRIYNLKQQDGLCFWKAYATIQNNNNETDYFHATVSYVEGVYIIKLVWHHDEYTFLKKYFDNMGVLMSVVELGPNDGEYEWRHIMANKTTQNHLSSTQLFQFAAKERRTVEERKRHHDAALKSKRMGTYAEVDSSTFTFKSFFQQPTCFIQYIGAEPLRNIDLYATLLVDYKLHDSNRKRLLQLAEFIEFAPQLMGIVELRNDRILTLQYANSFTADKLGVPVDKITGLDITKSGPFPVIEDYIKLYQDSRKESAPLKRDIFEEDPGMLYWTATVSCISYDKENNVSLHAFLITDKSDIRRAERELKAHKDSLEETVRKRTVELQEKELRFKSLVSNAPNIILTIDCHGLVHFANRHFGSDDASLLVGKHFYTLVVEGEELMTKIRTLFETAKSFILEVKLIDADIWLNLNVGYMDRNSAIIVATDITKIKQLSDELHNALTTKSRFLANMSHEIRTPLSGIIGMSRILVESGLTMDQTECVATIQNCGETLLSVINSILDYTKLEANGMLIDKSEISLLQTVEDSLYTVLPTVQAKGLELVFDIDPRVPDRVLVDPLRLKQVIINLLNNAVKFTEEGYILVSIRATEIGDMWKLWFLVKDTGCGVLAESQGKLFQMFSQVDVSTTRRYGGTGIGLALAKRLLELMDGDISMDSSGVPGEGCSFRFSLLSATAPFAPISPSSVSSPKWLVASAKILIVGKCKIANEVLKKRLEGKGLMTIEIVAPDSAKSCSSPRDANLIIFYDMNQLAPNERPVMLNLPNIITIFMDYTRPPSFDNDYPDCQFLRKPIKESALIRCLREICAHFDTKQKQSQSLDVILRESGKNLQPQNQVYPLSILVVEDNEINQKVARRVFQHIGYPTISIANHGREALDMIEKMGMPDIIFMDVQMPILDGMETTKMIRSQYPTNDTQIVAMTANAFPEDRINCLQAGMNDFLTKPIRQEQVQNVLQKCYKLLTMANSNIRHNSRFGLLHVNV